MEYYRVSQLHLFRDAFIRLHQRRVELLSGGKTASKAELEMIRAAIMRMHRGTYGFCEDCREQIPKSWLDSDPLRDSCPICEFRTDTGRLPSGH